MKTSAIQQAIESGESLPIEDQEILLDIPAKTITRMVGWVEEQKPTHPPLSYYGERNKL